MNIREIIIEIEKEQDRLGKEIDKLETARRMLMGVKNNVY